MKTGITGFQVISIAALLVAASCGGSSPSGPTGGGGQSGATVTIGTNGAVTPAQVTITAGQSVTFTNNSGQAHNIASDPHPSHSDCPAIASVGALAAGQTKQTGAFTTARSCGFHDHDEPTNAALKGTIVVR